MNINFEEHISKSGVTCHSCFLWLRRGSIYFKDSWIQSGYRRYHNYCPKCLEPILVKTLNDSKKLLKLVIKEKKRQNLESLTICSNCKNKYKNVVGECAPTKKGCRPQLEIKNEEKKSRDNSCKKRNGLCVQKT